MILTLALLAGLWPAPSPQALAGENAAPTIHSETWINSAPLTAGDVKGRVLLVEFWTFGCYNCRNVEPHIKQWHRDYADKGLTVIGVHAPEFGFERDAANLRAYIAKHGITYPVAVDNDFANWYAWHNRAWPTLYLVDRQGNIRYQRIGEGGYRVTEATIRRLLDEPSSH
ncbi:MAG TPA: redoxin domain-containing protein [Mariprofundaceae bacterium]|nr:redoxin domain-containing protein [Mariprofundaceae bacterium]